MALRTGTGRGPGHLNRVSQGSGGAAPPAASNITQLEVMGGGTLDPLGAGPYDIPSNGSVMRCRFLALTNTAAVGTLDPSKFTVTVSSPGYDDASTPVTRVINATCLAVLRRQSSVASAADLTTTTQVAYQAGAITVAPTIGVAVDFYLTLSTYVYSTDTVVVTVADGWNGLGSTGGTCPPVTNSSTMTFANYAQPLYAFVNTELNRVTASPYNVELCVFFHRYGMLGQWVAGVELFARDGTNIGAHVIQNTTSLSAIQTREAIGEAFKVAVPVNGINETDGSNTLGPGNAYIDGYIYPYRGVRHQISVDGAGYPGPAPEQVLPFCNDLSNKYGGGVNALVAYVGASAGGTPKVYIGDAPNRAAKNLAAYGSINLAAAALATAYANASYTDGTTTRPASSIAHSNPHAGRISLLDNAGVAIAYELTGTYTPASTGNCWLELEADSSNTAVASYNAANVRVFTGAGLRIKCDYAKNVGYISGGGLGNFAFEGNNVTFTASSSTALVSRCDYRMFLNVNMGNIFAGANLLAPGLGTPQPTDNPARAKKVIGLTLGDSGQPGEVTVVPYFMMGVSGRMNIADPNTSLQSTNDGFGVYNCKFMALMGSTVNFWNDSYATATRGFAVVQNVYECVNVGGNNVGFSYNGQNSDIRNVGWAYNSGGYNPADDLTTLQADDRGGFSLGYRSAAGAAGHFSDCAAYYNHGTRLAFKGDYIAVHSFGVFGNVGNNPQRYGIDCAGNGQTAIRAIDIGGAAFAWRAAEPLTADNMGLVQFQNNQNTANATWSAGLGFGSYILTESVTTNPLANRIPAGFQKLRYDLYGRLRKQTSAAAVGASECLIP